MRVTQELLSAHQHRIESLTLITGGQGVFDVHVDDDLIYSKAETGRQANPGEVLAALEQRLEPGFTRYG